MDIWRAAYRIATRIAGGITRNFHDDDIKRSQAKARWTSKKFKTNDDDIPRRNRMILSIVTCLKHCAIGNEAIELLSILEIFYTCEVMLHLHKTSKGTSWEESITPSLLRPVVRSRLLVNHFNFQVFWNSSLSNVTIIVGM